MLGVTIPFVIATFFTVLIRQDFALFLILAGAYAVAVGVISLACWWSIPRHFRQRPEMPAAFHACRIGAVSPDLQALLAQMTMQQERDNNGRRHRHYRLEQSFPNGTWNCHVELADDQVVAYSTAYRSNESQILDCGSQHGRGVFLICR